MTVMTTPAPTLTGQQTSLLSELNAVLARHPLGEGFAIMYAPADIHLTDGEVLVQVVNPQTRITELHPRKLTDLAADDILHTTQVIDPTDQAFLGYATHPQASECLTGPKRLSGSASHVYSI
ncbi:hypothetical protein ACWF94_00005 [Streptomyces sp. NPDC055078]